MTNESLKKHWENVYKTKVSSNVSWYQPHLEKSLELILKSGIAKDAAIIDVGGGASTLADDLLLRGFNNVSVLDLSAESLAVSKLRLGESVSKINWIVGDLLEARLPKNTIELWHDRAVFHFLTEAQDRKKYLEVLHQTLKPNGVFIIATFSLEGPERCSGLNVVRYDVAKLQVELGERLKLVDALSENHQTPFGTTQKFVYCFFRKTV